MIEVALFIFLSLFGGLANGEEQYVTAKGQITCRGIIQPGIFVQMYDEDSIPFFDNDDLMGSTTSDAKGTFCVKGKTDEWTIIEPYIYIEHNCGYESTNEKGVFILHVEEDRIKTTPPKGLELLVVPIELLKEDAPKQKLPTKHHHHHSFHFNRSSAYNEMIQFCTPHYVQYRTVFEKMITKEEKEEAYVLAIDETNPTDEVAVVPSTTGIVGTEQTMDQLNQEEKELEAKVEEDVRVETEDESELINVLHNQISIKRQESEKLRKVLEADRLKIDEMTVKYDRLRKNKQNADEEKIRADRRQYEERRRQEVPARQEPPPVQPVPQVPQVITQSKPATDPCQIVAVAKQNSTVTYVEDPCDRRIR